jgi:hypothetical protein
MKELFVLLVFVGSAFGQSKSSDDIEHAPTAAQCQADRALWNSQYPTWVDAIDSGRPFSTPLGQIGIVELLARRKEMTDCQAIDTRSEALYKEVYYYMNTIVAKRCLAYIFQTGKSEDYAIWEAEQQKPQGKPPIPK